MRLAERKKLSGIFESGESKHTPLFLFLNESGRAGAVLSRLPLSKGSPALFLYKGRR